MNPPLGNENGSVNHQHENENGLVNPLLGNENGLLNPLMITTIYSAVYILRTVMAK